MGQNPLMAQVPSPQEAQGLLVALGDRFPMRLQSEV